MIFPLVWQEIFDNGGILHPETIIEVWKSWGRGWQHELDLVRHFSIHIMLVDSLTQTNSNKQNRLNQSKTVSTFILVQFSMI